MSDWLGKLRKHPLQVSLIAVPLVACGLYLGLISRDRYVSESMVQVKDSGRSVGSGLNIQALLGGGGDASARDDAIVLKEYIESPDMLAKIDARLKLKQVFGHVGLDLPNRLSPSATREEMLKYYLRRVSVDVDDKTGMMTIRTQGLTPEFARTFNRALVSESETFLNELSHRISRNDMQFAREEIDRSYDEVKVARDAVIAFENKTGMLDPTASAEAGGRMVVEMQSKQAELEAELRNLLTYMNDDAPPVVAKRNALSALTAQIAVERAKLSAPGDGKMNRTAAQYAELKARLQFATDLYKVSLSTFEKARIESAHKAKSLSVIVTPNLPEEAEYPRKLHILTSLAVGLLLLFGVIRLTQAIIEDHRT
ncbi:lipopolysaccharide biosynthesis protein [Burkholderia sp. Ac-20353]|uniref:lipopolysaccharide biosynthesis protein n=1 Tax=Burkholderia sp. Ac-20353 TaxID=2703894 RepID=UPI00197BD4F3|nr:lipopolysaccharide biosynthesis protein [Burkholderia sp. Ac-20353]MBN3789416.1 lipopolysaccharide biosynthesis protein [Burkholderia sp. Ac-20353]